MSALSQAVARLDDRRWHAAATGAAVVALLFSATVCALLIWQYAQLRSAHPFHAPTIDAMRQSVQADIDSGADPAGRIDALRRTDLELRRDYFRRRSLLSWGAWMLLIGVAGFIFAAKLAQRWRPREPRAPDELIEAELAAHATSMRRARTSVAATAVLLTGGVAGWLIASPQLPPLSVPAEAGAPVTAEAPPTPEELAAHWPGFRGHDGLGLAHGRSLPTAWNGETGEGVRWKSPLPLPGVSSPVVFRNKLIITGADKQRQAVLCFEADTGRLLWETRIGSTTPESRELTVFDQTCYAVPTAVTDGVRAYVLFASGDAAAVDMDGRIIWQRNLGVPISEYGYASSPRLIGDRLIVQYDVKDFRDLMALDTATGDEVWKITREVGESSASPLIAQTEAGGQIVTASVDAVVAHDPADGRELWRVTGIEEDHDGAMAPSPIDAGGLIIVVNPGANALIGIRPDGSGDVTETHVAWRTEFEDGLATLASPVSDGEHVFLTAAYGIACVDVKTGQIVWNEEIDGFMPGFAALSLADGLVFVGDYDGVMVVLRAARQFEIVSRAPLGEPFMATPAFMPGRVYIRSNKALYGIEGAVKPSGVAQ